MDPSIKYKVGGTVEIVNDCIFNVNNFYITPAPKQARWFCDNNSLDNIMLSKEYISGSATNIDISYNIKDTDPFLSRFIIK